jgi:hypothetical protein
MSEVIGQEGQAGQEVAAEAKQALHDAIVAKFNNLVDTKEFKFSFKTDKETGFKRPTVELRLPVLSVEGIVDILQNGDSRPKELELLLEVLSDAVYAQARTLVNDKEDITQENFPLDKVSWAAIANMPKAERRGGGIAKETWEDFAADYIAVMPQATGKTAEQVGLAAKLLTLKFAPVKTQKPVINMLQGQLGIYLNVTQRGEEFAECIEFLNKKAETLLTMTDEDLLANL